VNSPATVLALFRISVFALLITSPDVWTAVRFAGLPPELRVAPLGWGWAAAHLPMDATSARLAQVVLLAAGGCALVGLFTRISAALATLSALYLLGIPQLVGTVRHYHHLVWFAALLAVSPSGDALSLDARRRRRALQAPIAYALPLYFAWALVACVYFFPGLWKWKTAGLQWALSDNLRNQMRWKWLQYDWLPLVRIDRFPRLCRAGALATMIFEVSFPLMLPFRRLRAAAVTCAVGFHLTTSALMRIAFPSLWLTYVMFVPWRRAPLGRARVAPTVIAGTLLVAGAVWAGLGGATQAWPFACYPTFQWMAPDEMPALEVDVIDSDGKTRTLGPRWSGADSQRTWGQTWSLVQSADPRALESFLRLHASAVEARFYRVYLPVDPDHWRDPPKERTLIHALP
jgi:HTTM domain